MNPESIERVQVAFALVALHETRIVENAEVGLMRIETETRNLKLVEVIEITLTGEDLM